MNVIITLLWPANVILTQSTSDFLEADVGQEKSDYFKTVLDVN